MARSLENQRPARRFSDSETMKTRKRTGSQPFDNSNEKFGRRQSAEGPLSRRHTGEMQATNTVSSSYEANRKAVQMDDETKSFCDSVSSIACSNFATIDVDKRTPWNKNGRKFPDKISKLQAIEKWLQSLPEPGS